MKILVIFHRLGPYHHARLRALSLVCDLEVVECSSVDLTYAWDIIEEWNSFKRTTLFRDQDIVHKPTPEIYHRLEAVFQSTRPDVVAIPGWSARYALTALILSHRYQVPAILMSESSEHDHQRVRWREWIKMQLVRGVSAALVGGSAHISYLEKLGVEPSRIFTGYDVVDNDYFTASAKRVRDDDKVLRAEYGLPEHFFLSSNRFIAKKNLFRLIDAYKRYRVGVEHSPWKLVLLGDGELRPEIERYISKLGLEEDVLLPGFVQYPELPVYYGLAEVYIHASTTEQWGLVVNEAMASGLPVIVSNRCGCAMDLVPQGRNGFQFNPYDCDELSRLMAEFYVGSHDQWQMGKESLQTIVDWSPQKFAENMLAAARVAVAGPRYPSLYASILMRLLMWFRKHK